MTNKPPNRKEVVGKQKSDTMEPKPKPSEADVQRYLKLFRETDDDDHTDPLQAGWDHMNSSRGWR